MPYKDPKSKQARESLRRRQQRYRERKRNDPNWKETQRLKQEELRKKDRKSHNDSARISHWKARGMKCENNDFDKLTQIFNNTHKCEFCYCELELKKGNTKNRKVTDHHHASGYFRNILCNSCNIKRGEVDRKMLSVLLELHRYFMIN